MVKPMIIIPTTAAEMQVISHKIYTPGSKCPKKLLLHPPNMTTPALIVEYQN